MKISIQDTYKILTLMIAMKRHRRNSVVFKGAYYKLAPKFGLSAQTFKKYILQAVELGFARDEGDRYVLKQMSFIVTKIHQGSDLYFGQHGILKGNQTSFKEVLSEVYECYVIDNIFNRQRSAIKSKCKEIELIDSLSETAKRDSFLNKSDWKKIKKLCKGGALGRARRRLDVKQKLCKHVITSCRHTGRILGVSKVKANKVLQNLKTLRREIQVKWIYGATLHNFEMAKIKYPKATIYAVPSVDKIKVCFGSTITLGNSI